MFKSWALGRTFASLAFLPVIFGCAAANEGAQQQEDEENVDAVVGAVCKSVKLVNLTPGILPSGSSASLSATNTVCDPGQTAEFRFLYRRDGDPAGYIEFRAWGPSPLASFNNTLLPSGKYTLLVRARFVGSAKQYESVSSVMLSSGNVCPAVTLAAAPPSPQLPGPDVALTSSATCTEGGAEYEFSYRDFDAPTYSPYIVLRTWGGPTFSWDTGPFAVGEYTLLVRARGAGNASMMESMKTLKYTIADKCATVTESLAPPSPVASGTLVTISGNATCVNGAVPELRYRYRLRYTYAWTEIQTWSTATSAPWNTTGIPAGDYQVRVEARAPGTTTLQGSKILLYTLTAP
jgi:hypothetical protein